MATINRFDRDPGDVSDFQWDWSDRLASGETISSATVTVVGTGVTIDSTSSTDTTVTAWVSGGEAGTTYTLNCRITTNQARIYDQQIHLVTKER